MSTADVNDPAEECICSGSGEIDVTVMEQQIDRLTKDQEEAGHAYDG